MRTIKTGWDQFRLPPKPVKVPIIATHKGVDGIDRVQIDSLTLKRQIAKITEEVWDNEQ